MKRAVCRWRTPSRGCKTLVSDGLYVSFPAKYQPHQIQNEAYDYMSEETEQTSQSMNSFSMLLPPPNVTGALHLGHALTVAIQDSMCRFRRMRKERVIWVPGMDHAGIATQVVVEKFVLAKTGLTRKQLGRDRFEEEMFRWKTEKEQTIIKQLKQLGATLDWPRYTFTLDQRHTDAVTQAIIKLYDDGLMYRDNLLINWCCHLQSALSDIEVNQKDVDGGTLIRVPGYENPIKFGKLFEFSFPVCDSTHSHIQEISVATTRPETVFGDVAVAVHPEDGRYTNLVGKHLWHPLRHCQIPVVADTSVDPDFGTGAVKITSAHSKSDYNIAVTHSLPFINIFDDAGCLTENCQSYAGLPRFKARDKVIEKLSEMGLLKSVHDHKMQIPVCGRTGDIVELIQKPQWFLKCDQLSQNVLREIANNRLHVDMENHLQIWCQWLQNSKDWCISRQLWWGHRLPLYETEYGWVAATDKADARTRAKLKFGHEAKELRQDEDVIDTWFSSALLPFSIFGWPKETNDMQFYPLSVMETGYDILRFWVSRMIMLGMHLTGQLPFNKVILHGMICDEKGRKMSKSLGNVVTPESVIDGASLLELHEGSRANHRNGLISESELQIAIEQQNEMFPNGIPACGVDALRLTLLTGNIKDQVIHFDVNRCHKNVLFCNKIWQASKFVVAWCQKHGIQIGEKVDGELQLSEQWILSRLAQTMKKVDSGWNSWQLNVGFYALKWFVYTHDVNTYFTPEGEILKEDRLDIMDEFLGFRGYHDNYSDDLDSEKCNECSAVAREFFVDEFCDIFIELSKPVLCNGSDVERRRTCAILLHILDTFLRSMAPAMPLICDELRKKLPGGGTVWKCEYPRYEDYHQWLRIEIDDEVKLVREVVTCIRNILNTVQHRKTADVIVVSKHRDILQKYSGYYEILTRCRSVLIDAEIPTDSQYAANTVDDHTEVFVANSYISKHEKYIESLHQKIYRMRRQIDNKKKKLKRDDSVDIISMQNEVDRLEEFYNALTNGK